MLQNTCTEVSCNGGGYHILRLRFPEQILQDDSKKLRGGARKNLICFVQGGQRPGQTRKAISKLFRGGAPKLAEFRRPEIIQEALCLLPPPHGPMKHVSTQVVLGGEGNSSPLACPEVRVERLMHAR